MDTTDMHAASNRLISSYLDKKEAIVATIELNKEQADFLIEAMNWWKDSGVNVWSAMTAVEIGNKLK
jgi:hypothetical protein